MIKNNISESIAESWAKLSPRWKGEDAESFYNKNVTAILDKTECFESACVELDEMLEELSDRLQLIERELEDY